MTLKKCKIRLTQNPGTEVTAPKNLLNNGKNVGDVIRERGIRPIKDESDFDRIFGGYKEWFKVDDFLKEAHRPWK